MKTPRVCVAAESFFLYALSLISALAVIGCGGSYGNGGGGSGGTAPYITTQPSNQSVALGQTATFTVVASGTAPLSYQWRKSGSDITGATSSSYTTPATTTSDNGETFDVVVSNSAGSATSNAATLTVTSGSGSSAGWKWVQDAPLVFCSGSGKSGCTITIGNITPTVAGSVWVLIVETPNNVTITNVCSGTNLKGPGNPSGCSGTNGGWTHCPNCHATNPLGDNVDAFYTLSGPAGTVQDITFTLSGSAGTFLGGNFIEVLPPAGSTASFDGSTSGTQSSCSTCTAPTLNGITGTDVIIRNDGNGAPVKWNSWSAPYITDSNAFAIGLNITNDTGPTVTYAAVKNPEFMAIAFKSSLGTFIPPSHQYSIVNFTALGASCSPSCNLTIPSTGAGNLLFLEAGDEAFTHISSVSGGGTWNVPMGANTCQFQQNISSQNNAASCAYNLSSVAGTTSLTVTMSGTAATNFAVWEINSTVGTWSLDTQGAASIPTGQWYANGPSLTLSQSNDVIFQLLWAVGGSLGPSYYAQPYINNVGTVGPFNYFLINEVASVVLLDSGPTPPNLTWINDNIANAMFVTGVAFSAH